MRLVWAGHLPRLNRLIQPARMPSSALMARGVGPVTLDAHANPRVRGVCVRLWPTRRFVMAFGGPASAVSDHLPQGRFGPDGATG